MRLLLGGILLAFGIGCMTRKPGPIETQVVTFPEGALVELNGIKKGRGPAAVVLPQNADGQLTEPAVLVALPNTGQSTLYPQRRILDPGDRDTRVPNKILIDLTVPDPDAVALVARNAPAELQHAGEITNRTRIARPARSERSKPTRPVGIDRWHPGKY